MFLVIRAEIARKCRSIFKTLSFIELKVSACYFGIIRERNRRLGIFGISRIVKPVFAGSRIGLTKVSKQIVKYTDLCGVLFGRRIADRNIEVTTIGANSR